MTSTRTAERGVQNQILDIVSKSQDVVIKALQKWNTAVQSASPSFLKVNLPYADKLPKPETLVSNAYDFAEQLLAAQHKFAKDMLQVTAPRSGHGEEA